MRFFSILVSLTVFTGLLVPRAALAQTQDIAARRESFERGERAIKDKDWEAAERIYMDLWQAQRSYDVALSLGLVELNLKRYADAAEHFQFGLTNIPPREKPELVQRMRDLFELAKQQVGAITVATNQPGAEIYVDSKSVGTAPLTSEIYVNVGTHVLSARQGSAVTPGKTIDALAGRTYEVDLELERASDGTGMQPRPPAQPANSGPPLTDRAPDRRNYLPAIVAASGGGVALAGGIISLVVSMNKHADAQERLEKLVDPNACGPGMSAANAEECHTIASRANSSHTFRTLSFAGFGATLLAGVVTYVVWPKADTHAARLEPAIDISDRGLLATVHGHF
jgi:hypothetical protein